MSTDSLSWALVVATYKRAHILPRCVRLAANQTRQPREIIIVDASPDWDLCKASIEVELSKTHPHIPLTYVKANVASLTAQRNQGILLAKADVVFLIDDDSLMYPDCASAVMDVYEADPQCCVQGVSAIGVPQPPDEDPFGQTEVRQSGEVAVKPAQTALRKLLKRLFSTEGTYFIPYEADYPDRPVPSSVPANDVGQIRVMVGYAMTFRRPILLKEKFCEVLQRYASGEDQDLSYRVSRHGALVNAVKARLCHLEISGGRLSLYTVTILAALNPAVLQQLYSDDKPAVNQKWRKVLWRRLLIGGLKDVSEKRWTLPRMRGVAFAFKHLGSIQAQSPEQLAASYPLLQAAIINNN